MARFGGRNCGDDWFGMQLEEPTVDISFLEPGRVWVDPDPLDPKHTPKKASKKNRRDQSPFPLPPGPLER
jgi:hypothetical protein